MKNQKFTKSLTFSLSVLLILYFGNVINVQAQEAFQLPGPVSHLALTQDGKLGCQLHLGDDIANEHHSISSRLNSPSTTSNGRKPSSTGANIIVQYFNFDPFFTPEQFAEAATAFQSAVDAWAMSIDSEVPIFVAAVFQPLGDGVLGSAGPTGIFSNFDGLERDSWYGNALADKLTGEDLDPTSFDIIARFSTVFPNWYFGTDGNTPANDYDFKTVVMHELCHGLGFFGSMTVDNVTGIGSYGFGIPDPTYPAIYDRLHSSSENKSILKDNRYPNFSVELGNALLGGTLNAKGPQIKKASNGKGAEMFTILDSDIFGNIPGLTDVWLPGSSYSHVDYVTYFGSPDGLMVPFLSTGLSYSAPGELTLAIFDDIGWNGKVNSEVKNGRIAQAEFDEINYQQDLKMYPNPVSDNLSVSLEGMELNVIRANLIDPMGRSIGLQINRGSGQLLDFDLSQIGIRPGAYVLRLQFDNQETANIRLLKN